MLNVTSEYKEAILKPDRYIKSYVTVNGLRYEEEVKSIKYNSSIVSGGQFTVGTTNASTVEIEFTGIIDSFVEDYIVKAFVGVMETGNEVEYIPLGEFLIDEIKIDRNSLKTKIKATDKMKLLNKMFESKLAYPARLREVVQEICNYTGVRLDSTMLSTKNVNKVVGKTCREALSYLAQIENAFVIFNRKGGLEFRKLSRTNYKIAMDNYYLKGLELNEVSYRVSGITADLKDKKKTIYNVGTDVGSQIKLTNPIMTQEYLNNLFIELKDLNFKPYKLKFQGNPALEVGDWVQIEDKNGSYVGVPVLDMSIDFNGGLSSNISADVKGSSAVSYEYKGSIQRQIELINQRLGADGTTISGGETEPQNPKEGDTWFKPNGAFTDLYIYENNEWVLKTSTSNMDKLLDKLTKDEIISKKFISAIAKIIELDASKITSGYLDTERLKVGSISSHIISDDAKADIKKGMISEEKYNELVADNTKFKSEIGQAITKEIDKVKVGARNLLTNVEYSEITDSDEWRDYQAIKFLGVDNAITSKVRGYYLLDTVKFEKDKTYTLSFDVINLSDFDINFAVDKVKLSKKVEVKAKENKRVDITFNRKDFDEIMIAVETELNQNPVFCVKNVKVEEGNKATSWTPAIEDLEKIDKQLSNAIEYLSSDNKDLLKKYEGLNLENAKIRHQLSTQLKQTRDEFLFQFNNYKQLLDETGKALEQRFNDFSRYIRFKAGNIELGDINSPFKTLLTHEKISFFKSDVEVAYISNNKLYITDAYIINSLRIGNFEFIVESNGGLSFRKAVN